MTTRVLHLEPNGTIRKTNIMPTKEEKIALLGVDHHDGRETHKLDKLKAFCEKCPDGASFLREASGEFRTYYPRNWNRHADSRLPVNRIASSIYGCGSEYMNGHVILIAESQ